MGVTGSVNTGNITENNISVSVVNESSFSVENISKITNNMQKVVSNTQNFNNAINNFSKNVLKIDQTIVIEGDKNKITNTFNQNTNSKILLTDLIESIIADTTDFNDISIVETISEAINQQKADAAVSSEMAMTTQVESSGFLTASLGVFSDNKSITNTNTSVTNIFKSAVTNQFSSDITRMLKNISEINNARESISKNNMVIDFNQNITINGNSNELKNIINQSINSDISAALKAYSSTTNLVSAITSTQQKNISKVTSSQTIDVETKASNVMSSKTISNTTGAMMGIIVGVIIIVISGTVIKSMGSGKNSNQKIEITSNIQKENKKSSEDNSNQK